MYKLLTKSLDGKKNQDIPRLSQDEQSIEQQFMRLIRIGEDFEKLKLKRIWMQILLKRSRTAWVRQEEEITRKGDFSVDEVIRAIEIVQH